ncbi:HAD-like protein [Apiospora marii]|uniref:HAD-like protein n=1 Tax=Apiospora marii TaxID=335849 RepID=A0ABR1R915_9PEZI
MPRKYTSIIFDLGGVLLQWDKSSVNDLSAAQFTVLLNSTAWHDLDRGELSVKEACVKFGQMLDFAPSLVENALVEAQLSLVANHRMLQLMHNLKAEDPNLNLYVMSNISKEHFEIAREKVDLSWHLFTKCFASGYEGMRKPDLAFFQHVVREIGDDPREMIFVDDSVENICAARSLGIQGVLMDDKEGIPDGELWGLVRPDSLERAEQFMKANAGHHDSVIEGQDLRLRDNFAQLMIWELTGDEDLVYLRYPSGVLQDPARKVHGTTGDGMNGNGINGAGSNGTGNSQDGHGHGLMSKGLWNYFCEAPSFTTKSFPPDADTTATAYLSLPAARLVQHQATAERVLDVMATNLDPDGIMQTYFAADRPRTVPDVCCNMLRLFHRLGRLESDPRVRKTEDYVVSCLENRACLYGSRHYTTPESFLYFVARLYDECGGPDGNVRLRDRLDVVKQELLARVGVSVNPLALALRIAACQFAGMEPSLYQKDLDEFKGLQQADGGWPAGHFCCYGRTRARIGNRGLATALAIRILRNLQDAS